MISRTTRRAMTRLALRMDWVRPEIVAQMQAAQDRAIGHLEDCLPCYVTATLALVRSDYESMCPAFKFDADEFMRLRDLIVTNEGHPGPAMKDGVILESTSWRAPRRKVHQN